MGESLTKKHVLDSVRVLGTATANEIAGYIQQNYRKGVPTVNESGKILREFKGKNLVETEYDKTLGITVYTYIGE